MEKKRKIVPSIIGLIIILTVMIGAFYFRTEIENYAITGYIGVFIACIAATSTVLLPAPGILVVVQYAQFLNPLIVILLGGLGTSIGELIGYVLGRTGGNLIKIRRDNRYIRFFNRKPYLIVFLFSALPLPIFDIVGILSGITNLNPYKFWFYCFLGKVLKMATYVIIFDNIENLIKYIL